MGHAGRFGRESRRPLADDDGFVTDDTVAYYMTRVRVVWT